MKSPIVFMSPVLPAFTGNGLAMRAAQNLQALSSRYSVHLLVMAMYGGQEGLPDERVLRHCEGWKRIQVPLPPPESLRWSIKNLLSWRQGKVPTEWSAWTSAKQIEVDECLACARCEAIWVFRFYLLPWVRSSILGAKKVWLDLDEMESTARRSQAELLHRSGHPKKAAEIRREADLYGPLEKRFLGLFEKVLVASEVEAIRISPRVEKSSLQVWPNVVSPPLPVPSTPHNSGTLRILFIGSLGHFPNREAVHFAAGEVLPALKKLIPRDVVLMVAGAGADAHRSEFEGLQDVEWAGAVSEVHSLYSQADMVIVPLHAGGGTRIKILEAFAHRVPVVSTRLGAEGLKVVHGRELLIADDPQEMADACAQLARDPRLGEALAKEAFACWKARFAPEVLLKLCESLPLCRELLPGE